MGYNQRVKMWHCIKVSYQSLKVESDGWCYLRCSSIRGGRLCGSFLLLPGALQLPLVHYVLICAHAFIYYRKRERERERKDSDQYKVSDLFYSLSSVVFACRLRERISGGYSPNSVQRLYYKHHLEKKILEEFLVIASHKKNPGSGYWLFHSSSGHWLFHSSSGYWLFVLLEQVGSIWSSSRGNTINEHVGKKEQNWQNKM